MAGEETRETAWEEGFMLERRRPIAPPSLHTSTTPNYTKSPAPLSCGHCGFPALASLSERLTLPLRLSLPLDPFPPIAGSVLSCALSPFPSLTSAAGYQFSCGR